MSGYECHRHPTQISADICGNCARPFCDPCLLYLDGEHALPRCRHCVLVAAGIRPASSVRRAMSGRQLRRLKRDRRRDGRPAPHPAPSLGPLARKAPTVEIDAPERDPFAWADDLDGGWSVTYRP